MSNYPTGVTGNERAIRGWSDDELTCVNFGFEEWAEMIAEEWFGTESLREFYEEGFTACEVDDFARYEIEREKFSSEINDQ